jgi:hypothetical protein
MQCLIPVSPPARKLLNADNITDVQVDFVKGGAH